MQVMQPADTAFDSSGIPVNETLPAIYFDYSDLVSYFRHNRFPTGIQRVQIEFFKASVEWDSPVPLRACTYSQRTGFWVDIDVVGFRKLCDLAAAPGSHLDPEWQGTFNDFLARTETRSACVIPEGAALVNLGASWWMADYMPLIREAKAKYGIRYIPLIYDLIPIITPEYCSADLVSTFSYWISSVFLHADMLAAISRCTQQDVIKAAAGVKQLTHDPIVMPLDAEFGGHGETPAAAARLLLLDRFGLRRGFYVLVVGTLEVRKNQMLIFQAWGKLIKQHGPTKIPTLVCAGKIGHGFDVNQNFLRAHPELHDKVMMLSGLSDVELNALYADCLFTVFSSTYEGWGLPVTESLCHGKVCLSADHSSLPEAGGSFAEFFESDSTRSLIAHAEKLLFDDEYRKARESRIAAEFRPRSWQAILAGLVDGIQTYSHSPARAELLLAPVAFGEIYGFGHSQKMRRPDREAAVAEMLRYDGTWHPIEPWGVWARSKDAKLAFRFPPPDASTDDVMLYLKTRAPHERVTLTVKVAGMTQRLTLNADESRLVLLQIPCRAVVENRQGEGPMVVHLHTDTLAASSTANDTRLLGIGLESFALCRTGDTLARLKIIEKSVMMSNTTVPAG